ncbi:leukocyte cell-derived chemotaxin 1-like [Lampris incognitus]|uniref:leukocyte cell-derived chemotaxin 1-like n=1 Tax=Lampris incognitus TaxID=2546036 RepID=UPI0024B5F34E|nr:leukocyte cell-derived chemotaxin 1-like [Lampris incognitus]
MKEPSEKAHDDFNGSGYLEPCVAPMFGASTSTAPAAVGRLLRFGAAAFVVGAILMLCASIGASYLWRANDKNVYNVHYSMSVDGETRRGSVEIDPGRNLERFRTGSGDEEAVEIHDFQSGITGIRFFRGGKCYVKSQTKANLPDMGLHAKEPSTFDLTEETLPVKFDEDSLVWVAADRPLKDATFLSAKILDLCGDLPIYWLHPSHPKDGERRKRDAQRAKRQFNAEELEAAAEEGNSAGLSRDDTSRAGEGEEEEAQSAAGSGFNPENPYHRRAPAGEEGSLTFDPMLDHLGICCSECRRSYTHCQRICEPLGGHWPWPYNYRGCQVACRVILPCRWWVARILGVV